MIKSTAVITMMAGTAAASDGSVVEVAVYAIAKADGQQLQEMAHKKLSAMPGYRGSARLTSAKEPNLYADIVVWQDAASAQQAADQVAKSETMKPFMEAIESMKFFRHYKVAGESQDILAKLKRMPYVELASYKVKDKQKQAPLQQKMHANLTGTLGFVESAPLIGADEHDEYLDVVGWTSPESMEVAGKALQEKAENADFFNGIDTINLFTVFKLAGISHP